MPAPGARPPAPPPSTRWALQVGGLGCLWLAFAAMMVRSYLGDPPDPSLEGTAAYGHNHAGALVDGLLWSGSEVVILYAILRPWSYRRSWGRAAGALALLLPWTAMSMVLTMHAGGVVVLHFLWLASCCVALTGVVVASGVAALRGR